MVRGLFGDSAPDMIREIVERDEADHYSDKTRDILFSLSQLGLRDAACALVVCGVLPFTTLSSPISTNPYMQQAVSHIAAKFTDQNKPGIAWWDAFSIIENLGVTIKLLETVECDLTQYQIQRAYASNECRHLADILYFLD